ncbi:hypothetical protein PG993_005775 [Apiospora rasikravindrae]|uniref:Uncharacterized protein n=1 Tax=Apiospora rasikravindrae TaxID=990691 RepID=A0ABR1T9S2_9PEZI
MAFFMNLPREIRDDILDRVLLSERPVPAAREDSEKNQTPLAGLEAYRWISEDKPVFSDPQTAQPTATALLLVSRQFHGETQDALKRLPDRGKRYKIDFVLMEERELWLTFVHVPLGCTALEQVDFTVRLVGTMRGSEPGEKTQVSLTLLLADGASDVTFGVYYALARFLKAGPTGKPPATAESRTSDIDRGMTVRHLVLNFLSPADEGLLAGPGERSAWMASRRSRRTPSSGDADIPSVEGAAAAEGGATAVDYQTKLMRPEWLAKYTRSHLRMLIWGTARLTLGYGRVLYERVGDIVFQVDGETVGTLDLGVLIDGMPCQHRRTSKHYDRINAEFQEWHKSVLENRRAAGLWVGGSGPGTSKVISRPGW